MTTTAPAVSPAALAIIDAAIADRLNLSGRWIIDGIRAARTPRPVDSTIREFRIVEADKDSLPVERVQDSHTLPPDELEYAQRLAADPTAFDGPWHPVPEPDVRQAGDTLGEGVKPGLPRPPELPKGLSTERGIVWKWLNRNALTRIDNLPTTREVDDATGVSRTTVGKVLRLWADAVRATNGMPSLDCG